MVESGRGKEVRIGSRSPVRGQSRMAEFECEKDGGGHTSRQRLSQNSSHVPGLEDSAGGGNREEKDGNRWGISSLGEV